jgi:dTDP-4-amino-4,6-dideoxygalactose transaminase
MTGQPKAFEKRIFVTKPMLPPLEDYVERLQDIWDCAQLSNGGPQHQALEAALGTYFDNPNVSLFNNGTIALVTACQALRLSGEVITTPFTFPATPHVLSWNNITPVFADIDPMTMNLDPANIEPLINAHTTAILAVHVYGTPCDVRGIQEVADRHGLQVIYDAAHAFGTRVHDKSITSYGDATMLSFHATKLFQTAEGGALVVPDATVKRRIDYLKNFGIQNEHTVLMPGINGKMSELQAAMGMLTLGMVEDEQRRRKQIGEIYRERLGPVDGLTMPVRSAEFTPSEQYFVVRIDAQGCGITRDAMFEQLKEFNIFARRYFFPLCSDYSCYRMLPSAHPSYLPNAHRAATEVLCLPYFGALSDDEVHQICDIFLHLMLRSAKHVSAAAIAAASSSASAALATPNLHAPVTPGLPSTAPSL